MTWSLNVVAEGKIDFPSTEEAAPAPVRTLSASSEFRVVTPLSPRVLAVTDSAVCEIILPLECLARERAKKEGNVKEEC